MFTGLFEFRTPITSLDIHPTSVMGISEFIEAISFVVLSTFEYLLIHRNYKVGLVDRNDRDCGGGANQLEWLIAVSNGNDCGDPSSVIGKRGDILNESPFIPVQSTGFRIIDKSPHQISPSVVTDSVLLCFDAACGWLFVSKRDHHSLRRPKDRCDVLQQPDSRRAVFLLSFVLAEGNFSSLLKFISCKTSLISSNINCDTSTSSLLAKNK